MAMLGMIAISYGLIVYELVQQRTEIKRITRIIKGTPGNPGLRGPAGPPGPQGPAGKCPVGTVLVLERGRCLGPPKPPPGLLRPPSD